MGGKGGGKKGGGGGGSVDVDVDSDSVATTVLDIVGLDDVNVELDLDASSQTSSTNRLELPDPIDTRLTVSVPDTIKTDQAQRSELAVTEPIVTQMTTDLDLDVDVKPMVMDLCLTVGIKDLPRFKVSRPYDKHIGLSVFGREVFGIDWCGSQDFIVDDVRRHPMLAGGTDMHQHTTHDSHHDGHGHAEEHGPAPSRPPSRRTSAEPSGQGLRVVID